MIRVKNVRWTAISAALILVASIAVAASIRTSENLKIIRGSVQADGTITAGAGFTVTRESVGNYRIDFSRSFNGTPTVVVTVTGTDTIWSGATIPSSSASSVTVWTWNRQCDTCNYDRDFNFIVAGKQ